MINARHWLTRCRGGAGCNSFAHVLAEKASFVGASKPTYLRAASDLRGAPVVAAVIYPIAWLMEVLRTWRLSERRTPANELAANAKTPDLYHERNVSLWCILPPC